MPELTAGSTILVLDTPPTVEAEDTTDQLNITSTSYIAGSPACSTTFVACTTGRAEVDLYGRLGSDGTNRIWLSYEVYLGSDATGTQIQAPNDNNAVCTKVNGTEEAQGMSDLLTGLTPGLTYFVRTMHRVNGGNTADVFYRRVMVRPAT